MRTMRYALAGAAGLCLTAAAPVPRLLLPVSDRDTHRVGGMGCESSFVQGETSYTFMRNNDLLVRTGPGSAGLHLCKFSNAQTDGFGPGPKTLSCGGRRLTIRQAGRATSYPEADSADYPAVLTVTDGKRTTTFRGRYGMAC